MSPSPPVPPENPDRGDPPGPDRTDDLPARSGESTADSDTESDSAFGKPGGRFAAGPVEIPGHEILGELGRGGNGVVYHARHTRLNRPVALKMILAAEHAAPVQLARFLTEAETVAGLKHPHIVQVYDFGQFRGRPYLSMEYLDGGTLSDRINGEPQPPRVAAGLAKKLASAMAHAHDRGVIHRDLKPGNVLLGPPDPAMRSRGEGVGNPAYGEPKVADFGLAKSGDSGLTATGAVMGTPSYMAPEQAAGRGDQIGPATDVYGLGAILYECLTGRPPLKGASSAETLRMVLDREPVSPRLLNPAVPRDLETICLKCLRKEATRRYVSPAALEEDLGRFLDGRPITARPVGALERGRRWVKRNPTLAGMITLLLGVIVIGAAGVGYQYDRALEQRDLARAAEADADARAREAREASGRAERNAASARAEAELAEEVSRFLEGLFRGADPTGVLGYGFRPGSKGTDITAAELLDRGAELIDKGLTGQPAARARLMNLIGEVYLNDARYDDARALLERSLALRRQLPDADKAGLAQNLHDLGRLAHALGDYAVAEERLRQALVIRRQLGDDLKTAETVLFLGWAYADQRDPDGERYFREGLELRGKHLPEKHRDIALTLAGLAACLQNQGRLLEAVGAITESIEAFAAQPEGAQLEKALTLFQRGVTMEGIGLTARADECFRESLKVATEFLGEEHPYLCFILGQMALNHRFAGELAEAEEDFRRSLRVFEISVGLAHPRAIEMASPLADLLWKRGKPEEAAAVYEGLLRATEDRFGPDHVNRVVPLLEYARLQVNRQLFDEAEANAAEALRLLGQASPPPRNRHISTSLNLLGVALANAGRPERAERAEPLYRVAAELLRVRPITYRPLLPVVLNNWAITLRNLRRTEAAAVVIDEVLPLAEQRGL